MHIALWSPGWPLEKHHNGIVTYVHSMRYEFEALGHRVSVFTSLLDPSSKDPRVHLVRRGPWSRVMRRLTARFASMERDIVDYGKMVAADMLTVHSRDPIDIIEMEETFGWAGEVARITRIPTLVKLHGPAFLSLVEEDLRTSFGRVRVESEGAGLKSAMAVAAPTGVTLSETVRHYGLCPPVTQVISNPLALPSDTPLWRLDECDQSTILFVGRFDRPKGADVMLQAFELLLRDRPELKLIVVGPDVGLSQPDGGKVHFEAFRDAVIPPKFRNSIDFRGRLAPAEIAVLRTLAIVTVVPSRWESQSYTALEAMFQGCPVVCSDAGGLPESVMNQITGLLAKSGDAADFARALSEVLDDPRRAAELGAAARRHVLEKHSVGKVVSDSLALYARVVAQASVKAGA